MDLFVVNRYDDQNTITTTKENKEENIFNKLKANIKRKQEELEFDENENQEEEVQDDVDSDKTDIDDGDDETPEEQELQTEIEVQLAPKENVEPLTDFAVLGEGKLDVKKSVSMILPPWLQYPAIIPGNLTEKGSKVKKLDYLDKQIKTNLKSMGISNLFPVQEKLIPWILDVHSKNSLFWPRDLCVSAPTGSGKTLAFAVPVVQLLQTRVEKKIRVLVVLPVQELAEQVAKIFEQLCVNTKIKSILLTSSVAFRREQKDLIKYLNGKYYSQVDIVITTAGRLVQHLNATPGICFNDLRFLIIDEADRVMDQIQNDWLFHLSKHVQLGSSALFGRANVLSLSELLKHKRPVHKLLFSATLSQDPEKLQTFKLFQPKLFTTIAERSMFEKLLQKSTGNKESRGNFIGKFTTPAELIEKQCLTEPKFKPLTVYSLIKTNGWKKFLCFTKSAESCHRLSFVLQKLFNREMKIEELSSKLSIGLRKKVLRDFDLGRIDGLVCTDALSRGIDVYNIEVVLSYDVPKYPQTYIHRVGRTARGGQTGTAITLLLQDEQAQFNKMLSAAGKSRLETIVLPEDVEMEYALQFANVLAELHRAITNEPVTVPEDEKTEPDIFAKIQSQVLKTKVEKLDHSMPLTWQKNTPIDDDQAQKKIKKRKIE